MELPSRRLRRCLTRPSISRSSKQSNAIIHFFTTRDGLQDSFKALQIPLPPFPPCRNRPILSFGRLQNQRITMNIDENVDKAVSFQLLVAAAVRVEPLSSTNAPWLGTSSSTCNASSVQGSDCSLDLLCPRIFQRIKNLRSGSERLGSVFFDVI